MTTKNLLQKENKATYKEPSSIIANHRSITTNTRSIITNTRFMTTNTGSIITTYANQQMVADNMYLAKKQRTNNVNLIYKAILNSSTIEL